MSKNHNSNKTKFEITGEQIEKVEMFKKID